MSKVFIKKFYKNKAVRYRITIPETSMEWNLDQKTYTNLKRAIFSSITEEYPILNQAQNKKEYEVGEGK